MLKSRITGVFSPANFRLRATCTILPLVVVIALFSPHDLRGEQKKKDQLAEHYREWLNRDVAYIITKQEKAEFLQLKDDLARDKFIEQFWAIRNPTPGSPENSYKDQIYQRIEYADAHFGIGSGEEGWRTDRGRTYITLGPAQHIQKYYGAPNLRPMEIWFYSNLNPALPPFFYVVFFQPDNIGDFRYYSPSIDGPDKLVTGMEAINDPQSALKIIQSSVGPEVARIAQTLIPGEPLDPDGRIGLQSDVMLSVLKNFANQPSNVDEISRRRELVGTVVSRMIVEGNNLDTVLLPVRDERGVTRLDYAIRLQSPGDLTMRREPDGRYKYEIEARVEVLDSSRKQIFTQEKSVLGSFSPQEFELMKSRPLGYEGTLPLPPGKYILDFLFTDWIKKEGFKAEREITVPETDKGFVIPEILPFSSAEAASTGSEMTPFVIAGVQFKPLEATTLSLNQLQDLRVAYQIWSPAKAPETEVGKNLAVQYTLGQPAVVGTTAVLKDTVDMGGFTSTGSLLNGKKISLAGKQDGSYMLTVSVNGADPSQRAYSSLTFQILNDVPVNLPFDLQEPDITADLGKGIFDQQRALAYLSQGNSTEARRWFRLALSKNHNDDISRAHLVQAYYTLNSYNSVISLFNDAGITTATDSGTIVQIAESFLKSGDTSKAASILQDAIHSRPDDGPLYLALADSYEKLGDAQRAKEMSAKGKQLINSESQSR